MLTTLPKFDPNANQRGRRTSITRIEARESFSHGTRPFGPGLRISSAINTANNGVIEP